jgi:hypothetical protein
VDEVNVPTYKFSASGAKEWVNKQLDGSGLTGLCVINTSDGG